MFTAHLTNEKIGEGLLAELTSPKSAYKYAIRIGKGTEHSSTLVTNPFGLSASIWEIFYITKGRLIIATESGE